MLTVVNLSASDGIELRSTHMRRWWVSSYILMPGWTLSSGRGLDHHQNKAAFLSSSLYPKRFSKAASFSSGSKENFLLEVLIRWKGFHLKLSSDFSFCTGAFFTERVGDKLPYITAWQEQRADFKCQNSNKNAIISMWLQLAYKSERWDNGWKDGGRGEVEGRDSRHIGTDTLSMNIGLQTSTGPWGILGCSS